MADKMKFENVCVSCSKPFMTTDQEDMYCPACWTKMRDNTDTKGEEKNETDFSREL